MDLTSEETKAMQDLLEALSKPGVHQMIFQHDDDCKTLKTGKGSDCTCDPDIKIISEQ